MLPPEVEDAAARFGDEYAWRRGDIPNAVRALETAGLAIVGSEAWVVRHKSECAAHEPSSKQDNLNPEKRTHGLVLDETSDWVIYGVLPTRAGPPLSSFTWDVQPKATEESWERFVSRSAAEVMAWIEAVKVEDQVLPHLSRSVFYNVIIESRRRNAAL
jgi:hypothetical protein